MKHGPVTGRVHNELSHSKGPVRKRRKKSKRLHKAVIVKVYVAVKIKFNDEVII